jgi:hypothetical protein
MGEMRNACKIWVGYLEGRYHSEDQEVDGIIILKCILGKYDLGMWIGFVWLRVRTGSGLL